MVRISERDRDWLNSTFTNQSFGKIMRGEVVYDYLYAEKVLKGYDKIQRRSCGCEYGSLKRMVDKLYKEFIDAQD
tara:strand:- start:1008 stop:1232 length:225 start_codon:yes stop_codon:yes gene_type:complete